jgi:membrane protease YdiL (CAAX protease family)
LDRGRLTAWVAVVSALTLLGYASRAAGGKPPKDAAYQYSTAFAGVVQYAIILAVVLAIARPHWWLLALRRPSSYGRVLSTALLAFAAVYVMGAIVSTYSDPGREQGLTPDHWDSHRALQFAVNFAVFVAVAPAVEELTFRGLGYSLLEPLGRTAAILWVGLAFGLAHGLL